MTLRIGVLGAASINRDALLSPASRVEGVTVAAIAARDPARAAEYAAAHGIPRSFASYDALLADPEIDAVYVPLPAALHGEWTLRALAAGKHVLCEKPFTANAAEAERVRDAATASGLVVMEAHHASFHPLVARVRELAGTIGEIERGSSWFHVPIKPGSDIRWNLALGGGSLMDLGVYPLRLSRDVLGPGTVESARAWRRGDIDRRMRARLRHGAALITVDCGMWSRKGFGVGFELRGTAGRLRVGWPFHPQQGSRIRVDGRAGRLRETADRRASYDFQLEAFRDAVATGTPPGLDEAVETMRTVDAIYRAAGMQPR